MISFFQKKKAVTHIEWLGIDIHSHLLPGIDDGAKNIIESVAFISALHELGFDEFICTPHIFKELYPNTSQTISKSLSQLHTVLKDQHAAVQVTAAAEYMMDETFQVSGDLLCLPGKHVLVEMSYLNEMPNIDQLIFDLQIKGYQVILAHPERYGFYHKKPEKYESLKKRGVLFQLNLLSINGYYGKDVKLAANFLLGKGFYELAATDLHHQHHLATLKSMITNGSLYQAIGKYPFKNRELFSFKNTETEPQL